MPALSSLAKHSLLRGYLECGLMSFRRYLEWGLKVIVTMGSRQAQFSQLNLGTCNDRRSSGAGLHCEGHAGVELAQRERGRDECRHELREVALCQRAGTSERPREDKNVEKSAEYIYI